MKKTCRKCGGAGHHTVYHAPRVLRKFCDCETGKKKEAIIKKQLEARDSEPVWELFTL